jgi:hypothetical protein
MKEVKLFRLNSGEEVIAKVMEACGYYHKSDTWLIKAPAILIPVGNGKLGMAPWLPYCDTDSLELPAKAIAFIAEPKIQLINDYNENFGSGLVVPEKTVEAPPLRLITE